MRRFEKDNTIQFTAIFKTFSGKAIDIDSGLPAITITNEVGTAVVNAGSMSNHPNIGTYYYIWTPTLESVYVVMVTGLVQGRTHLTRRKFRVVQTTS